ncbi:MAG: hypothetical protein H0U35_14550 [Sporichthyaceae bacterium]|nr:hypothetical protein [Sporichthyaceae bacterium]
MTEQGFDRLRRRGPDGGPGGPPADPLGRRALYSTARQSPALGTVTITCSSCKETAVTSPRGLIGLALPSIHLPVLRRDHSSWMRCPSCGRRTWVRLGLRL